MLCNMTIIKTNQRELVAVEVSPTATDFYLRSNRVGAIAFYGDQQYDWVSDKFDTTNCKIIGLLSNLTEQQAAEYAEIPVRNWLNCTAKSALDYTLTVNGLNTSAPILLIEKVK
jgi:hypothetical protein